MASISKMSSGKWRYRIRYKDNDDWREISKSGFKLKSEAQAAAAEIEKSLRKGIHVDEAKRTYRGIHGAFRTGQASHVHTTGVPKSALDSTNLSIHPTRRTE